MVKTKRAPTEEEWRALEFALERGQARQEQCHRLRASRADRGVGAGQMSRVDSVKLGAMKAILPLAGTVVASDAFFPFPDGVEEAVKHGATAFIQPGGSLRDEDVSRPPTAWASPWSSPASAISGISYIASPVAAIECRHAGDDAHQGEHLLREMKYRELSTRPISSSPSPMS